MPTNYLFFLYQLTIFMLIAMIPVVIMTKIIDMVIRRAKKTGRNLHR